MRKEACEDTNNAPLLAPKVKRYKSFTLGGATRPTSPPPILLGRDRPHDPTASRMRLRAYLRYRRLRSPTAAAAAWHSGA